MEEKLMAKENPIARTLTEWFEGLPLMDKLFLRDAFLERERKRLEQQMAMRYGGQVGGVDNVIVS